MEVNSFYLHEHILISAMIYSNISIRLLKHAKFLLTIFSAVYNKFIVYSNVLILEYCHV